MIPSCGNSNGVRGKAIKSDKKMYLRGACGSHELQKRLESCSVDLETYNRSAAPLHYPQIFGNYSRAS